MKPQFYPVVNPQQGQHPLLRSSSFIFGNLNLLLDLLQQTGIDGTGVHAALITIHRHSKITFDSSKSRIHRRSP